MIRSVSIAWAFRKDGEPIESLTYDRRTTVILPEQVAHLPNTAPTVEEAATRILGNRYLPLGPDRDTLMVVTDTVTSVCNCQPHPTACKYLMKFGGRRFRGSENDGTWNVFENLPGAVPPALDMRVLATGLDKEAARALLTRLIDKEMHR